MSEHLFTRIHGQIARRKAELKEQGKLGRREWNLIEKRAVAHIEKMAELGHRPITSRLKSWEIEFVWTDDGMVMSFVGSQLTVATRRGRILAVNETENVLATVLL